jgi:hypothetical protein
VNCWCARCEESSMIEERRPEKAQGEEEKGVLWGRGGSKVVFRGRSAFSEAVAPSLDLSLPFTPAKSLLYVPRT